MNNSNNNENKLIEQYKNTFSEKEKKAYEIAKSHLGMSFQIEKSIGYLEWKKGLAN
tara:strand:+ start:599 stop:766 length:168 start_codon:yes stop_codon:yes gene_type:complete